MCADDKVSKETCNQCDTDIHGYGSGQQAWNPGPCPCWASILSLNYRSSFPDPTSSGQSHEVSHAVPKSSLCSQGGPVFGFNFIEENWGVGVQAYNPNAQEAEA